MRKFESDSDSDDDKGQRGAKSASSSDPTHATPSGHEDAHQKDDGRPEDPVESAARQAQQIERLTQEVVMQALADLRDHRVQWELHRRGLELQYKGDFSSVDIEAVTAEAVAIRKRADDINAQTRDASRAFAVQQGRHRKEEEHLIAEINHLRRLANARR